MPVTRRQFLRGGLLRTDHLQRQSAEIVSAERHFLNRITWGPTPDDINAVRDQGMTAYLDQQLDPESIDDSAADQHLRQLPILNMDRGTVYSLRDYEYRSKMALTGGMIVRAVHSRRQLLERVVEFWSDHFNVSGDDYAADMVVFQREAIRKHALGNFREMLLATAKSPAMLFYLDNYVNVAEHPNENYARELLELHTLGVAGGYTEEDVVAVARAFSGWTVHNGTRSGFYFNLADHDINAKHVLGHRLPAGRGIEDGLHVLNILAAHPATAQFVCRKLCVRFVSDTPPQSLVDSAASVWRETGGAIKPVLRHILLSAEFQSATHQKLRRPLDFLIGALRATGTEIQDGYVLEEMLMELGQPPYGWHPPNGYPDVAGAWLSTNGLLARWNVAMRLTHAAHSEPSDAGWGLKSGLRERIGRPQTAGELVDNCVRACFWRTGARQIAAKLSRLS